MLNIVLVKNVESTFLLHHVNGLEESSPKEVKLSVHTENTNLLVQEKDVALFQPLVLEDHVTPKNSANGKEEKFVITSKTFVHGETEAKLSNKKDVVIQLTNVLENLV